MSTLPWKTKNRGNLTFGGRPGLGAHRALATLNEVIAGGKVGWVLEADLKNFFRAAVERVTLRGKFSTGSSRVIRCSDRSCTFPIRSYRQSLCCEPFTLRRA
jgi:hypothetical protein